MVRQSIFEKRRGGEFIFEEDDLLRVQYMEHDAESVMHRLEQVAAVYAQPTTVGVQ